MEFHLPTPFAAVRKFSFLRFLKEVMPDELWTIIDVSEDYFHDVGKMTERKCRRRPSAVLIRACDDHSEVTIEIPSTIPYPEICHLFFTPKRARLRIILITTIDLIDFWFY